MPNDSEKERDAAFALWNKAVERSVGWA
jgi:glycerol kinase